MKPGSQETLVDNKVSDLIQNHLPSQLKEGDSLLPKFIEKYYEFAESTIVHYDDLKLDEFNIVQEDGGQAYQLYGTHIAMGYDYDFFEGYYYPLYMNKSEAEAAGNNEISAAVTEHRFEEYPGIQFWMPGHPVLTEGSKSFAVSGESVTLSTYSGPSKLIVTQEWTANANSGILEPRYANATISEGEL